MADQTPETTVPPAAGRTCHVCHAPLEAGQDWCLACGAAAPSSRRHLPGKRAAASVAALTLALTGGAVAAAYAALSSPPAPPKTLASAVPPGTTPDTSIPTTTTPPPVSAIPTTPTTTLPKLPKVTGPSTLPPPTNTSSTLPPVTNTNTTTTDTTTTTTNTTTTPQPTSVKLALKPDDIGPYDPASRIVSAPSNRANLFDKDDTTAWTASAAPGEVQLGFGITVDLQEAERLEKLTLSGTTGGIEIYGTTADELPPDVTDPGWIQLGKLDSLDGEKTITFAKTAKKADLVLIWFTSAPSVGPTASLSSLALTVRR